MVRVRRILRYCPCPKRRFLHGLVSWFIMVEIIFLIGIMTIPRPDFTSHHIKPIQTTPTLSPEEQELRELEIIQNPSLCSRKAAEAGKGQKVVSFSLFKMPNSNESNPSEILYYKSRYFSGIQDNLAAIREFYPGWLMRIYTNVKDLPGWLESEPDLFICNTTSLPKIGDVTNIDGMIWRFLPIGDSTVDVFVVRDLDSIINNREQEAVTEWLQSDKVFHVMRDHPLHFVPILGGTWGSKNTHLDQSDREFLLRAFLRGTIDGGDDQFMLLKTLFLKHHNLFLQHDSYNCLYFPGSKPFPKQRKNNTHFVGAITLTLSPFRIVERCPKICRPMYGKTWKYC